MNVFKELTIERPDPSFSVLAQRRLDSLTKPKGSLGRLEEFITRLAAIARTDRPRIDKRAIFVFSGDHGITEENVSAYPKEVTAQMVLNFLNGGAAINSLAQCANCEVVVVDAGVDFDFCGRAGMVHRKVARGTRNFLKEPALSREEAERCVAVGIDLARQWAQQGCNLFGTGDMGIGNTTASSAIAVVYTGRRAREVTGRGTGISDESLDAKARVIEEAIARLHPDASDPIDVLSKVGGTEIGAIAGLVLGAAERRIPVVLDGLISTAGGLLAHQIEPAVKDYLFGGHNSVEIGHRVMLDRIGLEPILDLGLRLGEGTGAALAMLLLDAAIKTYEGMATFDEAEVSTRSD